MNLELIYVVIKNYLIVILFFSAGSPQMTSNSFMAFMIKWFLPLKLLDSWTKTRTSTRLYFPFLENLNPDD